MQGKRMAYAAATQIDIGEIPVIDIAALREDRAAAAEVGAQMRAAAEGIGFFYISGHGIAPALIDEVFRTARAFFTATLEQKQQAAVTAFHRGFLQVGAAKMSGNAKVDLKESFIWGLDAPGPDGIPPNNWPSFLPHMRPVLNQWFAAGNEIGWALLRAFAVALDAAPDSFVRSIDRPTSRGSIIYYPPQPPEMGDDQFGVAPHTDYGCLTLLCQDATGGLQVRAANGAWVTAHPLPGSFVVNVGDLLARWTNDRFRSTPHRVVNRSGRERLSSAIFVDPNRDTVIAPVVRPGEAARYEPVTCGEYIRGRLDAAFAYRRATTAQ
jgi:isopenicillin N synthase-like dioxygenase